VTLTVNLGAGLFSNDEQIPLLGIEPYYVWSTKFKNKLTTGGIRAVRDDGQR
jgi:hypothetical protein